MSVEPCFNLWYYLGSDQCIHMLAARVYVLGGTDLEKADVLKELSAHDWRIAHRRPPSAEIKRLFDGSVPYWALSKIGIESLYAELFSLLKEELPQKIDFPDDKLFFATPLYDFGSGFIPVEIGNGYIRSR